MQQVYIAPPLQQYTSWMLASPLDWLSIVGTFWIFALLWRHNEVFRGTQQDALYTERPRVLPVHCLLCLNKNPFVWTKVFPPTVRQKTISYRRIQNGSGAHPASCSMILGVLSLWAKRPERKADHSLPPTAEIKGWVELYIHSHIHLHGVVLSN
jgi:hypothetical protein